MSKGKIKLMLAMLVVGFTASVGAGEMRRIVSDYEITPSASTGIVRAFYYGPNTVIELEAPPGSFSAVDEKGAPLEFEPEGRFIRLVDRPAIFTITFSGRAATFRSRDEAARIKPPVVAATAADAVQPIPSAWAAPVSDGAEGKAAHVPMAEIIAVAKEAAKPTGPVERWEVLATDQWLSQTLKRWGAQAGWGVSWETRDFEITTFTPTYETTFDDAVLQMVLGVSESDAPVTADFRDDGRNKIVRIIKWEGNSNAARR